MSSPSVLQGASASTRPDTSAPLAWLLVLGLVLAPGGLAVVSLAVGSTGVEPIFQVLGQLLGGGWGVANADSAISAQIVWDIRAPRTSGAFLAVALLCSSGAVAQGFFCNPFLITDTAFVV